MKTKKPPNYDATESLKPMTRKIQTRKQQHLIALESRWPFTKRSCRKKSKHPARKPASKDTAARGTHWNKAPLSRQARKVMKQEALNRPKASRLQGPRPHSPLKLSGTQSPILSRAPRLLSFRRSQLECSQIVKSLGSVELWS